MRIALALTAVAALAVAWAVREGQLELALVLVFPVVYGTGGWALLAILSMAAAGLAWIGVWMRRAGLAVAQEAGPAGEAPPAERRSRHGGVILLGPIPIAWGSDTKAARWALLAGVALLGLLLLFWLLAQRRA